MKIFHVKLIILAICIISSCGVKKNKSVNDSSEANMSVPDKNANKAERPNTSGIIYPQVDGTLLLNSENGSAIGPNIKYMPEWSAFGWFTAADKMDWEVMVNKSGEYEVYLEWSVSNEEAGKEFLFQVKGDQLIGIVEQSGSWEIYKDKNIGKINLTEGRQKITFKSKTKFQDGALLDFRRIKLIAIK